MRVAIMQPYFFPYIGYFHLISSVDQFVIYDNIKYTKKGWINRNRYLVNDSISTFTLPLKKASDSLNINQRTIDPGFNRESFLNQLQGAYGKAPYCKQTMQVVENIVCYPEDNLFNFLKNSIEILCTYFEIETSIVVSSSIEVNHELRSQDKVIAICREMGAKTYINAIGGVDLYAADSFLLNDLQLRFIKSEAFQYDQLVAEFKPWLSIIDVMMFNPLTDICNAIRGGYVLLQN
jgi:hypothetical protein